ncbi:MAG: potassium transporter Kup [Gemmatimonadetes bacterium]|nr:potassium transporter Kup [Gemmatimonadota bacterium]
MSSHGRHEEAHGRYLMALSLTALGIVFGDIGTSPIYALRESFNPANGIAPTQANVLGILSLILWSLIIVISLKYLTFVMRADNHGEGGIIALTALVNPRSQVTARRRLVLVMAGLFGAALLYGDSMITPAISVLSAIEGLEVATPLFRPYVIPITLVILITLFSVQRRGTAGIGMLFGPVTLVWFLTLAVLGVFGIASHPGVIAAVNPLQGAAFFARNGLAGFLVLGSVFLVVTGGEALYADMGHFGIRPIRLTWFILVLPALVLNYFGQGAVILEDPTTLEHPFFLMAPGWALYPLVGMATLATIIASQAVISGAFSLTQQAIQLGYLPRMKVEHTSSREIGQVYLPGINWALMLACLGLVIGFRTSSNLAAAYGVAVTTDMAVTTVIFVVVAAKRWHWSPRSIVLFLSLFLIVDLAFWGANLPKIPQGGWFPIVVAAVIFTMMTTWKKGRKVLAARLEVGSLPIELLIADIRESQPTRVPGTAVFMHKDPDGTPPALMHNLKHNRVLHQRVVLMSVVTLDVPRVADEDRVSVVRVADDFHRVSAYYGFAESPDVPTILELCEKSGLAFDMMQTTFFLSRETLVAHPKGGMAGWRQRLFGVMARNSLQATVYFGIPPNRVVELGMHVQL